jgi:hypothetical protein
VVVASLVVGDVQEPRHACLEILRDLGRCVETTECFKSGLTFKQCLQQKDIGDCHVRAMSAVCNGVVHAGLPD